MSDSAQHIFQGALAVTEANNYLAVNLYRLLAQEKRNVFFSPFSISTALAMLFCGAKDETRAEMRSVLGYDHANIKDETVSSAFGEIISFIGRGSKDYVLAMANILLSSCDFKVKNKFITMLGEYFHTMLMEVDFRKGEKALERMNRYVQRKTTGKISNLLDSLDPLTVIVILNAIYFKGNWVHRFRKEATYLQYFYNHGVEDDAKEVSMMHQKVKLPYIEEKSFKALQLPYSGDKISMMILLPNDRDGSKILESELTPYLFKELKLKMCSTKVDVALPKFKLEYSKSLKGCFQELGLNKVFHLGAELGNINDSKDLAVSEIMHKAVIEVNEEGSEAAAATAVVAVAFSVSFDPEFIVDHPFIFVIYNTETDLIYFMGTVVEL